MTTGDRLTTLLVLLLASWAMLVAQEKPAEVSKIAEKVDKHYNALKTMRADFTEQYNGVGMARTESGKLYLKKPGKMRWEYSEPRKKLFLSDGKTAWFYVPGEQQARRSPVNKLDDIRSPLRFLLGKTKLMKEFHELGIAPNIQAQNPGDIVLRGAPKGMEDRVSLIVLEVTPDGRIDRIMIEEVDGAMTEFRFTDQTENVPVEDSLFKFQPPPGVEVVDGSNLGD